MRRLLLVPTALAVVLHAAACAVERDVEPPPETAGPADPPIAEGGAGAGLQVVTPGEAARPGIRFDPATARAGDRIGELVLDSIQAQPTIVDSTHVGVARFRGSIEITGRRMEHPDADLGGAEVCFEANAASAARLPRWLHDERRPWFCFTNGAAAEGALAGQGDVSIVIDEFTINRSLTDAVNSARFVQ